jgi:hypothetical protein
MVEIQQIRWCLSLFEEIVERCRQAGLVPGEGLAGDGSSCMATRAAIGAFKASMRFGKEIHSLQRRCCVKNSHS